jgi:16S rRNA (adenine1518-N6/adenine1519-N6)-dimethyltransferase
MSEQHPARRSLGQNFLVDPRAVERIVRALAPGPQELVLEIGPGRGALTDLLVRRAERLLVVELDDRLADLLHERHGSALVLRRGNILDVDLRLLPESAGRPAGTPWAVVGNLPYGISKPVAMKLVEQRACVLRAVLMFQKEVAERLTAAPGSRDYGPLTILAGLAYEVKPLFDLKPGAFRPRPKVVSTVTRWTPRAGTTPLDTVEQPLRACLAACFRSRRRTLRNNLRAADMPLDRAEALLRAAEIDGSRRAESLSPADFVRLARLWRTDL